MVATDELAELIEGDGIEYTLTNYTKPASIEDPRLREQAEQVVLALENFRAELREQTGPGILDYYNDPLR